MVVRVAMVMLVATMLVGCSTTSPIGPGQGRAATPEQCVEMYRYFDVLKRSIGTPTGAEDRRTAPTPLMMQGIRLRDAGCITMSSELILPADAALSETSGTIAIDPISLHAGVVTNMADDARVRVYFTDKGVQTRTVGSAALGRRVYLGPFQTEGDLLAASELANAAGFTSPYPRRF